MGSHRAVGPTVGLVAAAHHVVVRYHQRVRCERRQVAPAIAWPSRPDDAATMVALVHKAAAVPLAVEGLADHQALPRDTDAAGRGLR